MTVVRTMSSICLFLTKNKNAMCNGKDCLLANYCANYVGNNSYEAAAFDNCDVEFRPGFISVGTR